LELKKGTDILKCFSDEARIRILHLIYKTEEMCISDLELILDYTQTKTSRHLIYLKNNGLLNYYKADQWVYYIINPEHKKMIGDLLNYFDKNEILREDLYEYRTLYTNSELAVRQHHLKQKKFKLPPL
jgi:ArsR family transcriptional regulator, arsenate/arsenite/antimonite-responsive transcriptional repressor